MRVRHQEFRLWLPAPRPKVFEFFSNAANLDRITPPWLRFQTITPGPIEMREGTLIDYRLRLRGIPIRWRTRINMWDPPQRFVDEQIRGPYRLWIHEHTFEEREGGTFVRDHVQYAVPFDFLAHALFVKRDVAKIFAYREKQLRQLFAPTA